MQIKGKANTAKEEVLKGGPVYGSFANVADATSTGIPEKPPLRHEDSVAHEVVKEVLDGGQLLSPEKPIETHSAEVITGEVKEEELSDEDLMGVEQEVISEDTGETDEVTNSEEAMDDPEVHTVDDRASSLEYVRGGILASASESLEDIPKHDLLLAFITEAMKFRKSLEEAPSGQCEGKELLSAFCEDNERFSPSVKIEAKKQVEELFSDVLSGEHNGVMFYVNKDGIDVVGAKNAQAALAAAQGFCSNPRHSPAQRQ